MRRINKYQNLHFRSVEECLDYIPADERKIVEILREIILDCIPFCREKLAYNVPYYYRNRRICFIWPSSIPWGNTEMKGVQLGFCYGSLIKDPHGYLEKGNRKQVSIKTMYHVSDLEEDIIRFLLDEAVHVDQIFIK